MRKPEEGILNMNRENSGKFRLDSIITLQRYECF
jgi:hypothetical protein